MSRWSGLGAGFQDTGRWDVTSHRVEFSLPTTLVVMASAVSTSTSQLHSLFTAFEQTSFPCALGHSLVYAGLPSLTLQVAKGRA